jgi:signal peptidase I
MGDTGKFLLNVAAVLVIAGVLLRMSFIELVTVGDNGMAPTLVYGDEVLVWKGARVDMADVVVCEHPVRSTETVIGRAIAFAGHTVHTDRNGLYVDRDQTTTQPVARKRFYDVTRKRLYDMDLSQISYFAKHDHEFFVEHGESFSLPTYAVEKGVYLLGDNRSEAGFDSREFGEVNPDRCLGQVFLRWKPAPPAPEDEIVHHALDIIE